MTTDHERRRRVLGIGPRSISLSATLAIGIGALVFVAVAATLAVAMLASTRNTFTLLGNRADLILDLAEARVDDHINQVAVELVDLAAEIEQGSIDTANPIGLEYAMRGAMAATPQLLAFGLWGLDGHGTTAVRVGGQIIVNTQSEPTDPVQMQAALVEASGHPGGYWGELVYIPELGQTIVNRRQPIFRNGAVAAMMVAGVSVRELSQLMDRIAADNVETGAATPFILYGDDGILGHPYLARSFLSEDLVEAVEGLSQEQPLLTVGQLGDPVLEAMLAEATVGPPMPGLLDTSGFDFGFVELEDDDYLVLTRSLSEYGAGPITVGTHFPADVIVQEIGRLIGSAAIGIGIMVIAIVLGILMGKRIARPVIRLADMATQVSETVDFNTVKPLPGSAISELDRQARAFNAMTSGLRWMDNYLPRTLVRRLVRKGLHDEVVSISRELTVMFTDIKGFTAQSEGMPADRIATFLNHHFTLLAGCIEAEDGTIDKFIGDGLMAFWSAPDRQKDHADRACRAALAIRAEMIADNAARAARGELPVVLRIGIHSGHVVVGNIGAPGRVNYTIVGDAVNAGNRLEAMGKEVAPDPSGVTILISSQTAALLAPGTFILTDTGRHEIRGRMGRLNVLRLDGYAHGDADRVVGSETEAKAAG